MQDAFKKIFEIYPKTEAPFMHEQIAEWSVIRPLNGLKVIHHVPVVTNTLLKIACLIEAGADVTVTNPTSFCYPHPRAEAFLYDAKIRYIADPRLLRGENFDIYFDCGAQLYQFFGNPRLGAIELTGSGDHFYRKQKLDFPVISVDRTLTKQLETVFGCAESCHSAIAQITGMNPVETTWVVFGFGKIGRGVAYFCKQNAVPVTVVEPNEKQRQMANKLGVKTISPHDFKELERELINANVIVTATGQKNIMDPYPHSWFSGKILANLGVYDEFGTHFSDEEILNHKMPVNFVLEDPTPIKYIDPEFYIHNLAALTLLKEQLFPGVHGITSEIDDGIIQRWCAYHSFPLMTLQKWFT